MNPYREGSKLFEVYKVFAAKGIDAAFKTGIEIGLSMSTLKIQVKRKNWGGNAPGAAPVVIPSSNKVVLAPTLEASGKKQFCLKKGGRKFVVVREGDEQSICRWLDTGEEQCMSNAWFIKA